MEWVRGEVIGMGSFSTINLATPRGDCNDVPSVLAVKSTLLSQSSMLQKEKEILSQLGKCCQILQCFGDDVTVENGEEVYNVFLELACRGNLAQVLKKCGGSMNESDVRHCIRLILQGICYIHEKGYVHCDIKPQNILVCGDMDIKVADFGLAKKAGEKESEGNGRIGLVGTPLYMSPESIAQDEHEPPSDVWALGCILVEMISGKPAWRYQSGADVSSLLFRIGFSEELPRIPEELCEDGKDFLRRCFLRDPTKRWTAEMLLKHPFIVDDTVSLQESECQSPSPRSIFDFPDWGLEHSSFSSSFEGKLCLLDNDFSPLESSVSPSDKIQMLASGEQPNWRCSEGWITVREAESPVLRYEAKTNRFLEKDVMGAKF